MPPQPLRDRIFGLGPSARKVTALALLGLLILTCSALITTAINLQDRVADIRAADSDNLGWGVAHLRVDHLDAQITLQSAITDATNGQIDKGQLQLAKREFDVFYSRIDVVSSKLALNEAPENLQSRLAELINARTALTELYDETQSLAVSDWSPILERIKDLRQPVRDLSIDTIAFAVKTEQERRQDERELMLQFLVKTLLLGTVTALSAFLAFRLWRDLETRTAQVARAATMVTKAYEASLNAVIVSNLDGQIILCNAAAERMFRMTTNDMCGKLIENIMVPPRLRQSHRRRLKRLVEGKIQISDSASPHRTYATRSNGEEFPVEFSSTVDNDFGGNPILISFVRDISDQVAAENKMKAALIEARRHAAAKSTFLASMSHEMRTPLHGLIASLELVEMDKLDDSNRELIRTAMECSQRTLAQVNDVLEITRQGESKEARDFFSPTEIVRSIVRDITPLAEERGNAIELHVTGTDAEQKYYGYPGSFTRAVTNLATNASKFTHNGNIDVSLFFVPTGNDVVRLDVEVSDTGPGISEEDQRRIFQFFETVNPGELSADSGNGLGLPIAKIAVDRMGGKLSLESEVGKGSTFCFSLTLELVTADAERPQPALTPVTMRAPTPRNILIVDDNQVNLRLISEMLKRQGHKISTATNGRQAVDLAATAHFDIIMMDVSMPVMDGREATRRIRQSGKSVNSYIMGITALVDAVVPDEFLRDGMDSILGKPVSQKQLTDALRQIEDIMSDEEDEEPRVVNQTPEPEGSFDFDQLCGMVGEDMAVQLVTETVSDVQKAIDALETLTDNSADVIHHAVGPTGFIGWTKLSSSLKATELALRQNREDDAKGMLDSLKSCLLEIQKVATEVLEAPHDAGIRPAIMDHPPH